MALPYTVNWIEQGRVPVETSQSGSSEVFDIQRRIVQSGGKFYRQSRSRTGTYSATSTRTVCQVTYRATTLTAEGVTTQITESQAYAIMRDAYDGGCVSCTTNREEGPVFSVTKVEQEPTALVSNTSGSISWDSWSEWSPTLPS